MNEQEANITQTHPQIGAKLFTEGFLNPYYYKTPSEPSVTINSKVIITVLKDRMFNTKDLKLNSDATFMLFCDGENTGKIEITDSLELNNHKIVLDLNPLAISTSERYEDVFYAPGLHNVLNNFEVKVNGEMSDYSIEAGSSEDFLSIVNKI
ncbi:MAG: hypothetical protein SFT91_00885 [Rickettsiaceae bacterium]|nr:hypothetical protein [Rickettsiaceae bacterium]